MISPVALLAVIKLNLIRRPMMHPLMAEEILDVSRVKLLAWIDSGELPWAWNLGSGKSNKEIRILSHCVVEKATGVLPAIGATKNLNLPEVVGLILPAKRETIRGAELQRLFHVSPDLVRDLHKKRKITRIKEVIPATGQNASPRITVSSVARLLQQARIT